MKIFFPGPVCALCLFLTCLAGGKEIKSVNWPQFRGPSASGIAEGFETPLTWNVPESENLK